MTDQYHYFERNQLKHVQVNVIWAIGFPKYKTWKKIDKLFHVGCSMTATDLMIEIRSTLDKYEANRWYYDHLAKEFRIDDNYLCVYCQHRGIEFHVKRGQFEAVLTRDGVMNIFGGSVLTPVSCSVVGSGPSLMMSLANLHYELSTHFDKSFLPESI